MASTITALTGGGGVAVAGDTSGVLELKTNNGTTALTLDTSQNATVAGNVVSSSFNSASTFGFKNRIINGAMMIDQRNAGASVTIPAADQYTLDRWLASAGAASKFSVQQSSTSTAGFINSLLVTSLSAYTSGSGEQFRIETRIEGLNCSDLAWGTANASTVTLSFWTRSSLTGTFGGCLVNSAANRSYPFTYTISSANTWEQKSITIAGDTTGTWLTTNGIGIGVRFNVGSGSSFLATAGAWTAGNYIGGTGSQSILATNGATFYITGVQLEKGSTATSFDYRPYGTELALCQRYYWRMTGTAGGFDPAGTGVSSSTTVSRVISKFPVTMRTPPTAVEQSGTATHYNVYANASSINCSSVPTFNAASNEYADTLFTTAASQVAGQGSYGRIISTSGYLGWSAEL